jgi:hypothetical protein
MSFIGGSLFPNEGARIFVECENEQEIEDFVKSDPLFKQGLVVNYDVEEIEILGTRGIKELTNLLGYRAI